jgi:hypothetical protein
MLSAQITVKGRVADSTASSAMAGATVQLRNSNATRNAVTNKSGEFSIADVVAGSYKVTVSFVGFETFEKIITVGTSNLDLGTISLKSGRNLDEVVVKGVTPPAQQKGDTVQFNASQFKVNRDANVEDLVKKMPGIVIENGAVKAQGENVKKVTIDGREFFGDDATAALRNLPADVVDKIQVFDRLSDQAQLTGVDDGQGYKAINVVTREDRRNGQFGRIYGGYGTNDRYQAGGSVNFFNKDRRISVVGLFNNVNQQNFSGSDILGLTSGGSGRGGGAGRGGGFGGNDNFQVAGKSGITKTNALGVNFSDLWGKNFNVSGSYFFNNSINENRSVSNREQFITPDSSTFYNEISESLNKSTSHRINMRMEYKIDSNNTLLIIPSFNFQQTDNTRSIGGLQSFENGDQISRTNNLTRTKGDGYNFNNTLLFRHAFPKRGRSINLGITTGFNNRNSTQDLAAISTYFKTTTEYDSVLQQQLSDTKGYNLSANVSYTEPLSKRSFLQVSYNPSYSNNDADQRTWKYDDISEKYSILDTSLSNVFLNEVATQRGGLNYRFVEKDKMISIGLDAQDVRLDSKQEYPQAGTIRKSFSNLLPNAMIRWKLGEKSNIRLFYRSGTNNPSVNQLQNVINYNNPLFITTGNPDLDQSVSNRLGGRYTYTNSRKGNSFFVNVFANQADGYITNATYTAFEDSVLTPTVTLYRGSQLSKPINLNGYWNMNTLLTYSFPFKAIKSNLTFNAGVAYIKTPGLINNVKNVSDNYVYSGGMNIASNISEFVDFNINYNASYNIARNEIQPNLNNNYFSQSAGVGLNLMSKNGWVFSNDLNNQLYSGLSGGLDQNYWLWNMAVAKKFLKDQKGELRLSVFDLLKQNRSISRTVQPNYIEDNETQVLTQYFMLTFSYRIKNFGKAPQRREPARNREGMGMPWN